MGGRGSAGGKAGAGGNADINRSESIKKQMLSIGLNSNISGIRKKAEQGIGNYAFKDAEAVSAEAIDKITTGTIFHEKNGNTLIEGYINNRHVFYANKSDSPEIQKFKAQKDAKHEKQAELASQRADVDWTGKATTTYESALKKKRRKMEEHWRDIFGK